VEVWDLLERSLTILIKGYSVSILSRTEKKIARCFITNGMLQKTIDENAVLKADYIIHLAGENKKDGQQTKS
jgi:NAD dependent epimerase/dehydratase family enzyme